MLKRLIEVALPLKEISEQSGKDKRHLSALHIWWARRPLSACRAAVIASLIPDPDDPECPDSFRKLVSKVLNSSEFLPKDRNGSAVTDTPRNRVLEFIKYAIRWENSYRPEYIEPARQLISAAHHVFHPNAVDPVPTVIDPFSGAGSISLETLRLGCSNSRSALKILYDLCRQVSPRAI